jgi:hypothetical protein
LGPVHSAAARPGEDRWAGLIPGAFKDTDFRQPSMGQMHPVHARGGSTASCAAQTHSRCRDANDEDQEKLPCYRFQERRNAFVRERFQFRTSDNRDCAIRG